MQKLKLKGYIHTLFWGYIVVFVVNAILSIAGVCEFSVFFAAYYPLMIIVFLVVLNGISALITTRLFPLKRININSKLFTIFSCEKQIYEKLGVRKFKDRIPEIGGAISGFSKSSFTGTDVDYLERFIKETIISELVHFVEIIVCLLVFVFFNEYVLNFVWPLFLLNTYFNL